MKPFPKILLILGIFLLLLGVFSPDNYGSCHSDLSIAGYNDERSCLPDFVYQLFEAAFFAGIICIFASFYLRETLEESETTIRIFEK